MKFTVALDFGPACDTVVAYATRLAQDLGAELTLIHVHRLFADQGITAGSLIAERDAREELQQLATRITTSTQGQVEVACKVFFGPVQAAVLELSEDADLLILGQSQSKGLWRYLLGDVTEGILERAHCPVLVVPPDLEFTVPGSISFAVDDDPALPPKGLAFLHLLAKRYATTLQVHHLDDYDSHVPRAAIKELFDGIPYHYYCDFSSTESVADYILRISQERASSWIAMIHRHRPAWKEWFSSCTSERVAAVAAQPVLVFEQTDLPNPEATGASSREGFRDGWESQR